MEVIGVSTVLALWIAVLPTFCLAFEPSPLDGFHLMSLLKDVRKIVMSERGGTS